MHENNRRCFDAWFLACRFSPLDYALSILMPGENEAAEATDAFFI